MTNNDNIDFDLFTEIAELNFPQLRTLHYAIEFAYREFRLFIPKEKYKF